MTRTNAATKPRTGRPAKAAKRAPAARGSRTEAGPFNVKRRHLRFRPDPLEHAEISFEDEAGPFRPDLVALISEEAPMGGCGLVLLETPRLKKGDLCRVKVGRIDPLRAEVMWRQACAPGIIRIGMKFLE